MYDLARSFPRNDYVPFGYLDNPYHSAVLNRSGAVRSVPALGFGYWCRSMPWPYGQGTRRMVNYLSFLRPSIVIEGDAFLETEDFARLGVPLVSRYHTSNLFTYDFSHRGVAVRLSYHLAGENTLCCLLELENASPEARRVAFHAGHVYGYPEIGWWGSDGFASRPNNSAGASPASVAKIWASGDVFALRMAHPGAVYRATASVDEWRAWMQAVEFTANEGASSNSPDPVYSVLSAALDLPPGGAHSELITLTRGVNEAWTLADSDEARAAAAGARQALLDEDEAFYRTAPVLSGDWPADWVNGWVYDLETIRMNVREPLGIYEHHWDAMQVFTPRAVLGESVIDAHCLSYADPDLAKDVILGTFADAPMPNVPCSREDGSMNMVSMGGEECGTAPIWVLPFRSIRSVWELSLIHI